MDQSQIQEFLAAQDLFAGLTDEQRAFLAQNAEVQTYDRDQVIAREGEKADRFLLILEGELAVEVPAIAGPRLEITRLGSEQIFGWSWLIEPYKWHFNARTTQPTKVLEFKGEAILNHCEEDPAFGYALFKRFSTLMGVRLEAAQRKMMDQWSPAGFA